MYFLGDISSFTNNSNYEFTVNGVNVLLICKNSEFYLIENKCGHFGVPLNHAEIKGEEIKCVNHGISFSLLTGKVKNRPHENCDMIRIFKIIRKDMGLYVNEAIS